MKKLIELVTEFAENASRYEDGKRESALYDQLVRASYGMAYAVICAFDAKDINDRASELDRALSRSRKSSFCLTAAIE